MRFRPSPFVATLLIPIPVFSQSNIPESSVHPAVSMPFDRTAESYQIYSQLILLMKDPDPHKQHRFAAVRDETAPVVPRGQPCWANPGSSEALEFDWSMNPHLSVHPPDDARKDFEEILGDFDARCHQQMQLQPQSFHTDWPVHVLSPAEQDDFRAALNPGSTAAAEYHDVLALFSFSEVFFNANHTVALVYVNASCGAMCGEGLWVAFGLRDNQWRPLRWRTEVGAS
jgi:hypothetical protein